MQEPKVGEIWQHYKGEKCEIVAIATNGNKEQLNDKIVVYKAVDSRGLYYRELFDFAGNVLTRSGKEMGYPRFAKVAEPQPKIRFKIRDLATVLPFRPKAAHHQERH